MKPMRKLALGIVLGVIAYFLASFQMQETQARLLASIVFLVTLWTNEGLPLGVVSLLPIILFPVLGILETKMVTAQYSKSIMFLFLGGFFLGIAVEKTDLHRGIIQRMFSLFPYTPRGIVFSLAVTAAVLSAMLSNTTTTLLLMPLALHLTEKRSLKMRFVLAIAYGATVGGIMTPVGTPPNLIFLGFMEDRGLATIPFAKWMALTIPLALVMLVVIGGVLSYTIRAESLDQPLEGISPFTGAQKKLLGLLIVLAVLLVLNSPIPPYYGGLGLNEKLLLLGFGLMVFVPGFDFLEWKDTRKTPYEILFLFGAGFSIAAAVAATGLDKTIANVLLEYSNWHPFLLIILVATLVTFGTEITSNMALTTVAIPILYTMCQQGGMDPMLFMMVATVCASYAFMLPIATAPNAIAMSSGAVRVKEMASFGFVFNIIGPILTSIVAFTLWKYFL